jgi:hypothetical protein
MGEAARAPAQIISLPQGGGALQGLGEKFAPDLQTGTGNFSVPIAVPPGRNGLQPKLDLVYSTGNGNSAFGLGWGLSVPGVTRKTWRGVPRYDDARDTFILSGIEDLLAVERVDATTTRYRPRTEGLFAQILHRREAATQTSYWEVFGKDGLVSRYGAPPEAGQEAEDSVVMNPADPEQIFAWRLTETRDPFGNVIRYEYIADEGDDSVHRWRQPLLARIRYVDYSEDDETRHDHGTSRVWPLCCKNRQQGAGTKRTHQKRHARRLAHPHDLAGPNLQGESCRG